MRYEVNVSSVFSEEERKQRKVHMKAIHEDIPFFLNLSKIDSQGESVFYNFQRTTEVSLSDFLDDIEDLYDESEIVNESSTSKCEEAEVKADDIWVRISEYRIEGDEYSILSVTAKNEISAGQLSELYFGKENEFPTEFEYRNTVETAFEEINGDESIDSEIWKIG